MPFISGTDRSEVLLFPAALDDYFISDNPVRFIDAFVSALELAELGLTRPAPAETGRPAYYPADLLRLIIHFRSCGAITRLTLSSSVSAGK